MSHFDGTSLEKVKKESSICSGESRPPEKVLLVWKRNLESPEVLRKKQVRIYPDVWFGHQTERSNIHFVLVPPN